MKLSTITLNYPPLHEIIHHYMKLSTITLNYPPCRQYWVSCESAVTGYIKAIASEAQCNLGIGLKFFYSI